MPGTCGTRRESVSNLDFDSPGLFSDRKCFDRTLFITPSTGRQLRSCSVGIEPPEVSQAHEILSINGPGRAEMRPLMRTTGITSHHLARGRPPQNNVALVPLDCCDLTRNKVLAVHHIDPRHELTVSASEDFEKTPENVGNKDFPAYDPGRGFIQRLS